MIILLPTDTLSIVTSSTSAIDVHASWLDNTSNVVSVGRENTSITTATTTEVVAPPPSGTQRNVRTLYIRNRGVTSNDVTVVHSDGDISVELYQQTLEPGAQLQYNDGIGFSSAPVA
jgi:hypothetical protein